MLMWPALITMIAFVVLTVICGVAGRLICRLMAVLRVRNDRHAFVLAHITLLQAEHLRTCHRHEGEQRKQITAAPSHDRYTMRDWEKLFKQFLSEGDIADRGASRGRKSSEVSRM